MAIEAMKTAAMTYQGSVSGAAEQKNNKVSVSEADTNKVIPITTEEEARPVQPVQEDADNEKGFYGGNQQNNKQLQQAVEKLKKTMANQTEAIFGIHEGTNRVMIKIVDKETKDVIKEYPPEETLDMIQKVWEMAGIMVDEKL